MKKGNEHPAPKAHIVPKKIWNLSLASAYRKSAKNETVFWLETAACSLEMRGSLICSEDSRYIIKYQIFSNFTIYRR